MTQEAAPQIDTPVDTTVDTPEKPIFEFDKFGFEKAINKSIKKEGFTTPTPIQDMAILSVMSGSDLMGIAQTGSGKTAAFSLPVMNNLLHDYQPPIKNKPKVLIIAPTRELVMQIGKFIDTFSRGTPLKNLVVAGGQPYQPQIRKLKFGVDILIATPGRLIDHMGSKTVQLDQCHTFILDEADRMLDMGFIDEVKEMQAALREEHQTVMFSATMNPKVRRLSSQLLKDPEFVEQVRKTMVAETITHKLMNVRRKNKIDLLIELLQDEAIDKALIFARTKIGADNICGMLKEAFRDTPARVDAIHGDKKQRTREKILMNFRKGRTKILVATDVAARGIDVDGISHVINYELPIEAENYVHRVGRTGRAGQTGIAISFCDPSDMRLLREIEQLIKIKIDVDEDQKYHFDVSDIRDFKKGGKGGKGKFERTRSRKKEGGYPKKSNEGSSRKPREGRTEDRNTRRPEKKEYSRPEKKEYTRIERQKVSHNDNDSGKKARYKPEVKKEQRAYDPTRDSYKHTSDAFGDDPVLQKLRGKKVKSKPKQVEEPKGKREKIFGKKTDGPAKSKKSNPAKGRSKNTGKPKQTGGHKAFSPKRKTLGPKKGN